jgi:hypothetical protein
MVVSTYEMAVEVNQLMLERNATCTSFCPPSSHISRDPHTLCNYAAEMTRPPIPDSRPSVSSNRSQRREDDFEAALLNPQTLFISSSPNLDVDQPVFPSREADAPDPAQKRSFEDDYNNPGVTPVKGATTPAVIPPTPTTPGTSNARRDSYASTTVSTDSAARRLSRLKPLKAVGMDGRSIVHRTALTT